MKRSHISDRTKLAAVLCELLDIPHEHQLVLHEDQVVSLVNFDHYPVPKALGGSDHFSNLRALTIGDHRNITAKRDVPTIAKVKRLARANNASVERLLARHQGEPAPEPKRKHHRWPQGRKLRSRGFERRRT